jgi:hypothetical protein
MFTCLPVLILLHISAFGQKEDFNKVKTETFGKPIWYANRFLSLYLKIGVSPDAYINQIEGQYRLESKPNISYSCGFNYIINLNPKFSLYSGISFYGTKLNFKVFIPASDIPTIPRAFPNTPIVDYTEAYFHVSVPFLCERRLIVDQKSFWSVKGGLKLNYSGFNLDGKTGVSIQNSNGQQEGIYSSDFEYTNGHLPWINFSALASRNLVLSNKNILGIEIGIEAGKNGYVRGDYVITIPNKPVSTGIYKINGFSAGLTISYTFTGANRRLAKQYQAQ